MTPQQGPHRRASYLHVGQPQQPQQYPLPYSQESAPTAFPSTEKFAPPPPVPSGKGTPKQPLAPVTSSQDNVVVQRTPADVPPSFDVLKSPTTRVFEQMLGAAASIATPANRKITQKGDNHGDTGDPTNDSVEDGDGSKKDDGNNFKGQKQKAKKQKLSPCKEKLPTVPLLNPTGTENPFALIQRDALLYKKVVLCMALQRQPKETKDGEISEPPPVIGEGFYWKDYPSCETVLYESMGVYYELSKSSRQSKEQQVRMHIFGLVRYNVHTFSCFRSLLNSIH